MKIRTLSFLTFLFLVCLPVGDIQAEVSITAYNTGKIAGHWDKQDWYYVTGQALWREESPSIQVGCTAVLGCSLAVGTVHLNKFYPRYGFINIRYGDTWEGIYSNWIYRNGTTMEFKFPEPIERLSSRDTCSTIALYWNKDKEGGYQQWLAIPDSHCAPLSGTELSLFK